MTVRSGPTLEDVRVAVRGHRCAPAVWVDRTPWRIGNPLTAIPGADLEAVEVYRGIGEIPSEFAGRGDRCGAVVVWTRKPAAGSLYSSPM
jgi:hypothetical protein